MHVFVTGGSGLTGPAVLTELITAGHTVTGLARTEEAAARLRELGAATHAGSLDDLDSLRTGAAAADGVVHMAFGGDFADPDALARRDTAAIRALGEGLLDSDATDRPIVMTSGTFAMSARAVSTEHQAPDADAIAWFRIPGERACLSFTERGLRPGAVRLAPTVHGPGDYGFIHTMIAAARRTGVAGYVGGGVSWPAVHRLDAASLFRLALERGPAGSAYHGVAENVELKTVAEIIGETLDLPVRSLTAEQATVHFGNPFMAVATVRTRPRPASGPATRSAGSRHIRRFSTNCATGTTSPSPTGRCRTPERRSIWVPTAEPAARARTSITSATVRSPAAARRFDTPGASSVTGRVALPKPSGPRIPATPVQAQPGSVVLSRSMRVPTSGRRDTIRVAHPG